MEYESFTLDNGIQVVHKQTGGLVAYFGILINTGSRDEDDDQHGMAHLIEHALFKGTKKRKAFHILSRLEDVGGEVNAYTTKEETCVHASFLKDDFIRAIELLQDIVFNSVFPVKELDKEKEVIIDEINSYKDNPSELIFDEFEDLIFANNSLGRSILGEEEKLKKYQPEDLFRFIKEKYNTSQIVLSVVGNLPFKKVKSTIERFFKDIPSSERTFKRSFSNSYQAGFFDRNKDTYQAHCIIGGHAYDFYHDKRLGLHLMNNLLGGPGLNSRLNMSLREKKGLTYSVESTFTPYSDTGNFNIYFGTEKENLNKSIRLVRAELKKLRTTKLGYVQLSKAKKQFIGHLAIASENHENLMVSMAKSQLVYNNIDSIEDIARKLEIITSQDLLEIANELFVEDDLTTLVYN